MKWQCLSVWDFPAQFLLSLVWTDLPSITGQMMESKTENEVSHNLEQCFHQDATHYAVNYPHGRKKNEVSTVTVFSTPFHYMFMGKMYVSYMQAFPDITEDFTKKR